LNKRIKTISANRREITVSPSLLYLSAMNYKR
jgi:hypothetical protein